jgi:hypothetical protein
MGVAPDRARRRYRAMAVGQKRVARGRTEVNDNLQMGKRGQVRYLLTPWTRQTFTVSDPGLRKPNNISTFDLSPKIGPFPRN